MTPAEREAAIRAAMVEAGRRMYALDDAGQAELVRIYEAAADELQGLIIRHADADGSLPLAHLQALLRDVEGRLSALAAVRDQVLNEGLLTAGEIGVMPAYKAGGEMLAMMRAPAEAVQFVRAFVAADGLQLSDRLWRIDRGARDAVVNAIERAVVMGHGAAQSVADFMRRGQAVPTDVMDKARSAGAIGVSREAKSLIVGDQTPGGAMMQAARVFRTEINRAHGVAYIQQAEQMPGFRGIRFTLSPQHPKPDICDELAKRNAFGLGEGVYPNMEEFLKVWPAHPNTFSFPVAVFGDA